MTAERDAAEFTALVERRWPALVRAALLLGCHRAEAEDVAQSALTRCYQQWSKVRRAAEPDAYVHRVLVNTFIDRTRRRSYGEQPVASVRALVGEPEALDAEVSLRVDIDRALGALTPDQRIVVILRYYLDLSERQVAEAVGVPAGTVKSRLARGLAALADELRPEPDPGGPR